VTPEIIFALLSGAAGAFAGLSKALSNFIAKLDTRFSRLQESIDDLEDRVIRDYVLKEDFLRELQSLHNKLDRILEHILLTTPRN
jgi:flagellar capping protein FliD